MSEGQTAFEIVPPNALDFETHYQANRRELTQLAFLLLGDNEAATATVDDATVAFVRSGSDRPPAQELARLVVARCQKEASPIGEPPDAPLHQRFLALPIQQRCVIALGSLLRQDEQRIAQTLGKHAGSVGRLREEAMTALALEANEAQSFPFDLRSVAAHAETPNHWDEIDEVVRRASSSGSGVRRRLLVPVLLTAGVLAFLVWSTGSTEPTTSAPSVPTATLDVEEPETTTTATVPIATVQLLPGEQVLASNPLVVLGSVGPEPEFPLDALGAEAVWSPIDDVSGAVERTVALGEAGLGAELGGPVSVEKHTMVGLVDGLVVSTVWFRVDAVEPRLCVGLLIGFELTSTTCRQGATLVGQTFEWLLQSATRTSYAPGGRSVTVSYLPNRASVVAIVDGSGQAIWQRPVGGVSIVAVSPEAPLTKLSVLDSAGTEVFPSADDSG